jgi:hypothetical protein
MDWHELHKKKVTQLRGMAQEQGVTGTSGMNKDALVELLAEKLGIERPHLVVTDASAKLELKAKIKALKVEREAARAAGNHDELKRLRRTIHRKKRTLRKMAELAR